GSLARKSKADPAFVPALSAKENNGRRDAQASDLSLVAAPAPAKRKPPAPVNNQNIAHERQVELRNMLNQTVNYPDLEHPRATLTDVIEQLSKRYNLPFHLDNKTFRAIDPKIEAAKFEIAVRPIPEMHTDLKTILQTILERLPPKMGAMYLI